MGADIMKLDFATLAFGYRIKIGGGTPNWATALGQGKEHKINADPDIQELLRGIVYSSVSLSNITSKIGKGGNVTSGNAENSPIIVGALFKKVYVNNTLIPDGKYVLLITKDTSKSHAGRLRFKYGTSNTYYEEEKVYSNEAFWNQVKEKFNMQEDACFFIYDMSIANQDELHMEMIIVNDKEKVEYVDSKDLHVAWDNLIEEDIEKKGISYSTVSSEVEKNQDIVCEEVEKTKNCLEIDRLPRTHKLYPLDFIVYGAPGTGKTYSMVEYTLAIIENQRIEEFRLNNPNRKSNIERYKAYIKKGQAVFTTFHQNYGYEEFVQGLRPDQASNEMKFEIVDGVFKKIADKALNDLEDNNYVIIVDEINRANISKVFGELITLIEEDKRWGEVNEMSATLQYGEAFAVPNNLYIVGTMNSADKSISLIDAALRRRFDFIEQKPEISLIGDATLKSVLENINIGLVESLDSTDLLVGHSYFINKLEKDLKDILNNNIIPLLYEYFYDDRKKVATLLNDAIKKSGAKLEIIDEKVGRLRVREV